MSIYPNPSVEHARSMLAQRLAVIAEASDHGKAAHVRVRRFVAACLSLDPDTADPAAFTLEECRAAWRVTKGLTYPEALAWCQTAKGPPERRALAYPAKESASA